VSRRHHTGSHFDGISLTVVLGDVGVYKLNYIRTDGGRDYSRLGGGGGLLSRKRKHRMNRASSHGLVV
jgi:hypothetical protein